MTDRCERRLDYAARIVKLVSALPPTVIGRTIASQLLRSGTAAGANYEEAQTAESGSDFVHKLQVALKELRESSYRLKLLVKSEVMRADCLAPPLDESDQLRAILSKAVATAVAAPSRRGST